MIRRWAKNSLLLILGAVMFATAPFGRAAETVTNAPAGLYVSFCPDAPAISMEEQFIVDLKTNGVYSVLLLNGSRTNKETGVWRWDKARKEFWLKPNTKRSTFPYQLRVLRVDPKSPDTLEWAPAGDVDPDSGAVEYFKFKRKRK